MSRNPVVGLALGSGGARGWCHIGVLRELEALGVRPQVIAGCSMGALVGAFAAADKLDAVADWALSLTPAGLARLLDPRLRGGGLVFGKAILDQMQALGLPEVFDGLSLPFLAVATDLTSGRELWLRSGDLHGAVRASVAIPGVIAPHCLDGRWLVDGGLTDPVPVSGARALGAEVVIAVNPNARMLGTFWTPEDPDDGAGTGFLAEGLARLPEGLRGALRGLTPGEDPGPDAPDYFEVVNASIDILTDRVRRARLAGDPPQVLLDARLEEMSVLEMHRAEDAIAEGRRMVRASADAITRACGL